MSDSFWSLKKLFNFLSTSSILVGYQLTICLPFAICTIFIGRLGDPVALAAYGLMCTIINITFNGFTLGVQESIGVMTAKLFGANKVDEINGYFWKAMCLTTILAVIFHIFTYLSYDLMILISVQDEVALPCANVLKKSAFFIYFQGINGVFNNFFSGMHITRPIFYLNIVSIFIVFFFAKMYILEWGFREVGFAYTKLTQEMINTCFYVTLLVRNTDTRTWKWPSAKQFFGGFWTYMKHNVYTSLSFYGELIAYEVNTYYAALLHDVVELATWVTVMNFAGLFYFGSIGFANAIRNMIGHRAVKKQIKEAKADSFHYIIYVLGVSLIIIALVAYNSELIAQVFTASDDLVDKVSYNIRIYCFNLFPTLILLSFNTLYRVVGRDEIQFAVNIIAFPIAIIIVSYLFCFTLGLKVAGLTISFSVCKLASVFLLAYVLYRVIEWKADHIHVFEVDDEEQTCLINGSNDENQADHPDVSN